jgi:hypothetical protein
MAHMATPDPILAQISARFARFDVVKNRGGYTLRDRRSEAPVARLRPLPEEDAFELFYWSLARALANHCGDLLAKVWSADATDDKKYHGRI